MESSVASMDIKDITYRNCAARASSPVTSSSMDSSRKPASILRRAKYGNDATISDANDDIYTAPAHWPRSHRPSVNFYSNPASDPECTSSIVSDTYTRPRTHVVDVPDLYYSPADVKRFKREYRTLLRSQNLARARMEENSRRNALDNGGSGSRDKNGVGPCENDAITTEANAMAPSCCATHDNSFWRSKVGGRWSHSASTSSHPASTFTADENSTSYHPEKNVYTSGRQVDRSDPLDDGSYIEEVINDDSDDEEKISSESQVSFFSSVFDVAREAVSILNGPYHHHHHASQASNCHNSSFSSGTSSLSSRPTCSTSLHLVDTLYLF